MMMNGSNAFIMLNSWSLLVMVFVGRHINAEFRIKMQLKKQTCTTTVTLNDDGATDTMALSHDINKVSVNIPREILDKVIHEQNRHKVHLHIDSLVDRSQLNNGDVADYKDSSCIHCGLSVTPLLMQPVTFSELVNACESGHVRMVPGACAQMAASWVEGTDDPMLVETYSLSMVEKGLVPFATGNRKVDYELAYGVVLLNTGHYDDAIVHMNEVIHHHPNLVGAYHTRGAAYAKRGVRFPVNAEMALQDFTKTIELKPKAEEGWERRAEVYSALGSHKEAMSDMTTAISLKPSAKLYAHRATVHFREEDYMGAAKDFLESIRINRHQPDIYHLLGLAFYHQGKIQEAINYYDEALKLDGNFVDCLRSLGHAYRELGNFDKALESFNSALAINPNHVQSLQLRGSLLYQAGHPHEALPDFKACTALEPHNNVCQYMKGLSFTAIGQFYQAVKSTTRLRVLHMPEPGSTEQDRAMYIRELSRYLHSHLDTPMSDYSMDTDLDGELKNRWVKSKPFDITNYVEMPGLSPHIPDVEDLDFSELSIDMQRLICAAEPIGLLGQFDADGFLPNKKSHVAMGMASIEVAQTMVTLWHKANNNKVYRNGRGQRFEWLDLFDIAVRWRRLMDPDQPVLWTDKIQSPNVESGFNNHINLLRGSVYNIRFTKYYDHLFNLTKTMVVQHNKIMHKGSSKFQEAVDKVSTCDELLKLIKKPKKKDSSLPGIMMTTNIPSYRDKANQLEGAIFSLTSDAMGNCLFALDTATTHQRSQQFYAEIEYIWSLLNDENKKAHKSNRHMDSDSVVQLILSMVYYFYNLMPLSRGSSSVAYSVAVGLFLAIGKEVTGRIPKGTITDVEAILAGGPENLGEIMQSWMNIRSATERKLPQVSQTFPTLRTTLEALNAGAMPCRLSGQ